MYCVKKDGSGVFSNFLRILDWLWYSKYTGNQVCFDWTESGKDLLSSIIDVGPKCDQVKFNTSNWVEFCNLPLSDDIERRRSKIPFYKKDIYYSKGYFYTTPEIFKEPEFQLVRDELNSIFKEKVKFKDSFLSLPQTNILDKNQKNLGVHIRSMQHYLKNSHHKGKELTISVSEFYSENAKFVKKEFEEGGYDKVYVACDINDFMVEVKKLIPEQNLVFIDYRRGNNNQDWKDKYIVFGYDGETETTNCFIDAYNLSICQDLIMSVSNVAFGVLCMNSKMRFKMFPMLENLYGK